MTATAFSCRQRLEAANADLSRRLSTALTAEASHRILVAALLARLGGDVVLTQAELDAAVTAELWVEAAGDGFRLRSRP